ncbi:MAG: hypothetical protein C0490_07830 [Marivirga sp.]|nr:hypothetical protein [Marivirga sp.]
MNDIQIHGLSDDHVIQFLRELKSRLRYNSMRKVIALLRLIFSGIKKGLNAHQNALIESKTPRLLQLIFLTSCKGYETGEIKHLDEFVDTLYDSSQKNGKVTFKSEIDALRIVSIVLISLEGLYNTVGIQILNYTLLRELDEIVQEEAPY